MLLESSTGIHDTPVVHLWFTTGLTKGLSKRDRAKARTCARENHAPPPNSTPSWHWSGEREAHGVSWPLPVVKGTTESLKTTIPQPRWPKPPAWLFHVPLRAQGMLPLSGTKQHHLLPRRSTWRVGQKQGSTTWVAAHCHSSNPVCKWRSVSGHDSLPENKRCSDLKEARWCSVHVLSHVPLVSD